MKKRTGNHTKTAAITAIALTAAVMAPAMTMRNTEARNRRILLSVWKKMPYGQMKKISGQNSQ